MRERPASSFAHLLFVQAAISVKKKHLRANSERQRGAGGRVKDNREDELTLDLSTRKGKQEFFLTRRFRLFCWGTNSSFLVCTRKTNTLDFKNIPCRYVVFPFSFLFFFSFGFILFPPQNVHPRVKARLAL